MTTCPCASAVAGAFVLAPTAYLAFEAKTVFGLSVIQIAAEAEAGHGFAVIVAGAWVGALLLGLIWSIIGWRATLNHVESANGMGAFRSAVILAGCWWLLKNELSPAGNQAAEIGRAVVLAFVAGNVVNLYLKLRGLWTHKLPVRVPTGLIGELHRVIDLQTATIQRLEAQVQSPPALEMEPVFKHPGMRRAMLALLHPDRGDTEAERKALNGLFQTASVYFDKIGVR